MCSNTLHRADVSDMLLARHSGLHSKELGLFDATHQIRGDDQKMINSVS